MKKIVAATESSMTVARDTSVDSATATPVDIVLCSVEIAVDRLVDTVTARASSFVLNVDVVVLIWLVMPVMYVESVARMVCWSAASSRNPFSSVLMRASYAVAYDCFAVCSASASRSTAYMTELRAAGMRYGRSLVADAYSSVAVELAAVMADVTDEASGVTLPTMADAVCDVADDMVDVAALICERRVLAKAGLVVCASIVMLLTISWMRNPSRVYVLNTGSYHGR